MKTLYSILAIVILISNSAIGQDYALKTNVGHTDVITSIDISKDGKYIISGSEDKSVILWDVQTAKELKTFSGHTNIIKSISRPIAIHTT